MSKICDICGKTSQKGNLVPRGVGKRVTRRTVNHRMPNLRIKRFVIDGNTVKVQLCASCLKRINYEKNLEAAAVKAANEVKNTPEVKSASAK
jgi:ribosomal protein L28